MHRFEYKLASPNGGLDAGAAYLVGADGVPLRGEIRVEDGAIICECRASDPFGISVVWNCPGFGAVQLETTRLPFRADPYCLNLELVRHRLMRISVKREEWGLFDYSGVDDVASAVDLGRDEFVLALQEAGNGPRMITHADDGLRRCLEASEQLARFHAGVFLTRRRQAGGFGGPFLGGAVSPSGPADQVEAARELGFARVPFTWRDVQPREQSAEYGAYDDLVAQLDKARVPMVGGPLVHFSLRSAPDWMYLWENDYEAIRDFVRDYVRQTVKRYDKKVTTWIVATGLQVEGVFSLTYEQMIDLTRVAVASAREASTRARIVLDLAFPWGEYLAHNPRTMPPMAYLERVLESGLPIDAIGVPLRFGLDAEGYRYRDLMQVSSMFDRLANLGRPLLVTALAGPSDAAQTPAGAGGPGAGWGEAAQADWLETTTEAMLSKPYVESVCFDTLSDSVGPLVPTSGLLAPDGRRKPALERILAMRQRLINA